MPSRRALRSNRVVTDDNWLPSDQRRAIRLSCALALMGSYRGTSLIRNTPLLGPYKRTM